MDTWEISIGVPSALMLLIAAGWFLLRRLSEVKWMRWQRGFVASG